MFSSSASAFQLPSKKSHQLSLSPKEQERNKTLFKGCDLIELDCVRAFTPETISVACHSALRTVRQQITRSKTEGSSQSLGSFVGFQNDTSDELQVFLLLTSPFGLLLECDGLRNRKGK